MTNYWVSVEPGNNVTLVSLDSFDPNLESILADQNTSQELLTSLTLVRPDSEIQIIGTDTIWYIPAGASSWSQGDLNDFLPSVQKNTHKILFLSSAASLALSGTSFLLARQSHDAYLEESDSVKADSLYAMNKVWFWSGITLGVGAGGLMTGGLLQR